MEGKTTTLLATSHHAVLLFCTSGSVLAYEILLMRLLSISLWTHVAYMVISLALLGFGASGSFLFLLSGRLYKDREGWLVFLSGAASVSFPLAFSLTQHMGLDPLQLVWQNKECVRMFSAYLVMAVPFFFSGGVVGLILSSAGREVPRLYAADLFGAGAGGLAVVPALYVGPPWALLPLLSAAVLVGAAWCCMAAVRGRKAILVFPVSATLVLACMVLLPPLPKLHHTKAFPVTMAFPDAKMEAVRQGPLGLIHVVGSGLIREVPGLSLNYGLDAEGPKGVLPEQKAVFSDGEAAGIITRFKGDPQEMEHLDFTTMALPYHVRRPEHLLVVGAGGGTDALLALRHGVSNIAALEANPQIARLMTGPFAEFSGHLYSRPGVRLVVREARQFLHETSDRYDLIQVSLLDTYPSSAAGLSSGAESYLHTTEAFSLYLSRLSKSGILAVTRWLKLPPRDSLRAFATALSSVRRAGLSGRPQDHVVLIRSWKTSTLIVSKAPFTTEELQRVTGFCERRSFDVDYYAGITPDRVNRYDVHPEPYSFLGSVSLAGQEPEAFLKDYLFDVSPTTDDRPYFSHFFRWDKAGNLFRQLRREAFTVMETGYILLIATLVQAVLAGGVLILFPLLGLRRLDRKGEGGFSGRSVLGTLFYFGSIGLGFMFLEMALLPKFVLLLSHPIYSTAAVLGSVLVFAGCGSLSVRHVESRSLWIAVTCICGWVLAEAIAEESLFARALGWSFGARLILTVVMVGSLSFFLGWPFPIGLRELSGRYPSLVPWAWGINACASVIGAVLGKMISMSAGLRMTMMLAALLYLLSAVVFPFLFRETKHHAKKEAGGEEGPAF